MNRAEILQELEKSITFDEPYLYKNAITIHPVKVRDYYEFYKNVDILTIDKNNSGVIELIQMSYLEFIVMMLTTNKNFYTKFVNICSLVFKIDASKSIEEQLSFAKDERNRFFIKIHGYTLNSKEFENLKRFILYQNIAGYDDTYLDPDLQKLVDEYSRLKNSGTNPPSLSKQIEVVESETGITRKKLCDYTLFNFKRLYETVIDKIEYKIAKQASMSGMVKFDKPIEHFAYKKETNKLDGALVDYESVKNKVH